MNRLKESGLSQKELAERMHCSPQYISKLLKGSENLTLETISKLEECLDLDIVNSALSYVDGYDMKDPVVHMVAEPDPPQYGRK